MSVTVAVVCWLSIALVVSIIAFLVMLDAHSNCGNLERNRRVAKHAMLVSVMSPLWPLITIVAPAWGIRWVAGRYRQVMKDVVKA